MKVMTDLVNANALHIPLKDKSVQMCVTSPPYWGLRDYGIDNQIGLEQTPEEYVENMVAVFREVWRVLRDDGTLWLNLGDSYGGGHGGNKTNSVKQRSNQGTQTAPRHGNMPKQLMGIPWRVAFALQADGWCLRNEIIWQKANPMPESVKDRCTKAHEQIFILCKSSWVGDMPPRRYKKSNAEWLALLIETEGNVAIRRYMHNRTTPQHAPQVAVANSDITILEYARNITGMGHILEREGTNKPVYYLQWTTKEAALVLWECLPYMFGKRKQAECAIWLSLRRSNKNKGKRSDIFYKKGRHYYLTDKEIKLRDGIWQAVKDLNQSRPADLSWLTPIKEGRWKPNKYYYDMDAIREPHALASLPRALRGLSEDNKWNKVAPGSTAHTMSKPRKNRRKEWEQEHGGGGSGFDGHSGYRDENGRLLINPAGRNKRTVWTITTKSYKGAHFATFPPELPEICIKAGSAEGDIILDPFVGSGTTCVVARDLGRHSVGLDLSFDYLMNNAKKRLGLTQMEEWINGGKEVETKMDGLPMFGDLPSTKHHKNMQRKDPHSFHKARLTK